MTYTNPDDSQRTYNSLDDLLTDVMTHPHKLFMHETECEALVYVPEVATIFVIKDKTVHGESYEQRTEVLNRKYQEIRRVTHD